MAEAPHSLRIFLCHSSGDKQAVRELYQRLRADGFDPWLDEENLLPGQDWQQKIPEAVSAADVVLVCLSQSSITKKGYVQKEIKYALDVADQQPPDTIYLIPLKLEECDIPERLSRWHWVNLFEANGYARLLSALNRRIQTISVSSNVNNIKSQDAPALISELNDGKVVPEKERRATATEAVQERPDAIQSTEARRKRKKIKRLALAGTGVAALLGAIVGLNAVRSLRTSVPNELLNTNSPTAPPRASPPNAAAYFKRGYECGERKDYDCAIENYTKAIELNSLDASAYINRGIAYSNKGNNDLAIIDLNEAIELDPRNVGSYISRGAAYVITGKRDEAIKDFTKAIELNPQSADAYNGRAAAYFLKRKYHEAIKDYTKAIELNPQNPYPYNTRAIAYEKLGQVARAQADHQKFNELTAKK